MLDWSTGCRGGCLVGQSCRIKAIAWHHKLFNVLSLPLQQQQHEHSDGHAVCWSWRWKCHVYRIPGHFSHFLLLSCCSSSFLQHWMTLQLSPGSILLQLCQSTMQLKKKRKHCLRDRTFVMVVLKSRRALTFCCIHSSVTSLHHPVV